MQADFARRLGLALRQYRGICGQQHEDYSVTLSLSVLQSLLCSCMHLTENLASSNRIKCFLSEPLGNSLPASTESIVFEKAFPLRPEKFIDFVKILRDSMSHPNPITGLSDNLPTGFTSISNGSGMLNRFRFVWSPQRNDKGWLRGFRSNEKAQEWVRECIEVGSFPKERIVVEERRNYWYVHDIATKEPITKGVILELSCEQIYSLAIALSTLLAQPLNKNWDQQTIVPLEYVAA